MKKIVFKFFFLIFFLTPNSSISHPSSFADLISGTTDSVKDVNVESLLD